MPGPESQEPLSSAANPTSANAIAQPTERFSRSPRNRQASATTKTDSKPSSTAPLAALVRSSPTVWARYAPAGSSSPSTATRRQDAGGRSPRTNNATHSATAAAASSTVSNVIGANPPSAYLVPV